MLSFTVCLFHEKVKTLDGILHRLKTRCFGGWTPQQARFKQEENYRILIQYFKMEIEAPSQQSVFTFVQPTQLGNIINADVIYQIDVAMRPQSQHTHRLFLSKNLLYLAPLKGINSTGDSDLQFYSARVVFDLKFQIQYKGQESPQSKKIGLSFFHQEQQMTTFYCNNEFSIEAMKNHLSRYLNQKGFHSQFKPVKKLGKGNFASVYQVVRVEDGKKFAVKAFSKANTYSAENGKESLINQLTIMRELSHKSRNLLCLDSVYESDNSIYIVLELLEGKNLFEVVKQKNGCFSVAELRVIMRGLLRGLKCMNENQIMHRDLKPENIMFRHQSLSSPELYQPVIVDFGLAAQCERTPYLFFRCGTPGFVAPEIIKIQQNEKYLPACDVFSIGCIFHLLMTGQAIFPGTKYEQVYRKNKLLDFSIKADTINSICPFGLELLNRMLDSSPTGRISAAEALDSHFFQDSKVTRQYSQMKQEEDEATEYPVSPAVVSLNPKFQL